MVKNYKKDAIEILKGLSENNYKDIIFEIAKSNPYALIKVYNDKYHKIKKDSDEERFPYLKEIRNLISDGRFIQAIKLIRSETGCGLKEGKEFCDKIRYENIVDMSIVNIF